MCGDCLISDHLQSPSFVSSSYFNLIAIPTRHWPLIGPLTLGWTLIGQEFPEELDFNLIAQSTSSLLLLDPDRGHNGAKTPIWFFSPAPIPPLPRSLKRQLFHQRVLVTSDSINIPSLCTCRTRRDGDLDTRVFRKRVKAKDFNGHPPNPPDNHIIDVQTHKTV